MPSYDLALAGIQESNSRVQIGQTGLGKSTLINTIFASHLIDSKGRLTPDEPVRSTTEIQAVSHSTLCNIGQTGGLCINHDQSLRRTASVFGSTSLTPRDTVTKSTMTDGKTSNCEAVGVGTLTHHQLGPNCEVHQGSALCVPPEGAYRSA